MEKRVCTFIFEHIFNLTVFRRLFFASCIWCIQRKGKFMTYQFMHISETDRLIRAQCSAIEWFTRHYLKSCPRVCTLYHWRRKPPRNWGTAEVLRKLLTSFVLVDSDTDRVMMKYGNIQGTYWPTASEAVRCFIRLVSNEWHYSTLFQWIWNLPCRLCRNIQLSDFCTEKGSWVCHDADKCTASGSTPLHAASCQPIFRRPRCT